MRLDDSRRMLLVATIVACACLAGGAALAAPTTRCADESDAGCVVQRANAPARRAAAPVVRPAGGEPERVSLVQVSGRALVKPLPIVRETPPVSAPEIPAPTAAITRREALRPISVHAPRHGKGAAARPAPPPGGMKTLVQLSQSGGRTIG